MSTSGLQITTRVVQSQGAAVVLAKIEVYLIRERIRREENALFEVPFWRFLTRRRLAARLVTARESLRIAENAVAEAVRARDAARGVA